jgi:hypothetical protein
LFGPESFVLTGQAKYRSGSFRGNEVMKMLTTAQVYGHKSFENSLRPCSSIPKAAHRRFPFLREEREVIFCKKHRRQHDIDRERSTQHELLPRFHFNFQRWISNSSVA